MSEGWEEALRQFRLKYDAMRRDYNEAVDAQIERLHLPAGTVIVADGNRPEDRSGVQNSSLTNHKLPYLCEISDVMAWYRFSDAQWDGFDRDTATKLVAAYEQHTRSVRHLYSLLTPAQQAIITEEMLS